MTNDKRESYQGQLDCDLTLFFQLISSEQDEKPNRINHLYQLRDDRKYQELHHEICELMFDNAEQSKELWIRIDEQDDTISSENPDSYSDEDERPYYRVSIMTKAMLAYDRMIFRRILEENSDDNSGENGYATNMYRPYFFNFLTDPRNINQWFVGSFSENEEGTVFSGYIERFASPAEYKEGKIIISDTRLSKSVLHEINEVYNLGKNPCSSDKDIQMELDRILEKPELSTARIYNIGNGNCIYLKGRNSFGDLKILYDIGYYCTRPGKNINNKIYQPSISAIRSLKPQCVIISHWDSDHYYGCAYADPDVFRCKWIAPDLGDNKNVSARRVAKYLKVMKKIILVDRSSGRQLARIIGIHSEFKLYIGEKKSGKDGKITVQNKEGIVLEYLVHGHKGDIHTFMAGDVPYESIPGHAYFSTNTTYDYLVVPHHGAEMETSLLSNATLKKGYAIVSAKKGRLVQSHKDALTNSDYDVRITGDAKLCIEINLLNHKVPKRCH